MASLNFLVGPTRDYKTITAALNSVTVGTSATIIIDPGVYSESVVIPSISNTKFTLIPTQGSEANGIFDSSSIVNIRPSASGVPLIINMPNTTIKDIQITRTVSGSSVIIQTNNSGSLFENCLFKQHTDNPVHSANTGGNIFRKCIAWGIHTTGTASALSNNSFVRVQYENCLVYGWRASFSSGLSTLQTMCKNCVGIQAPYWAAIYTGFSSVIYTVSGTYNNASSNDSAPGPNSLLSQPLSAFAFIDAPNGNFHISASSVLRNAGANLSATFTRDIDNQYILNWPIGPDDPDSYNYTSKFVINKLKGTIPFYFRLTDVSDIPILTSASDYQRIWSITNMRTSAIEYFESTSASINYCISAGSLLDDTYTISLSAVI